MKSIILFDCEFLVWRLVALWVLDLVDFVPDFEVAIRDFSVISSLGSSYRSFDFIGCNFPLIMSLFVVEILPVLTKIFVLAARVDL